MDKSKIVATLQEIALLLELKGENGFKIRAYSHAAKSLEESQASLEELLADGEALLKGLPGIGEKLVAKIIALANGGAVEEFDNLRNSFPPTLFDLFSIPSLGPKKIKALYEKLGVDSKEKLKEVATAGKVAELPGFGAKSQTKIIEALAYQDANEGKLTRDISEAIINMIKPVLLTVPGVLHVEAAGSWRRGKEISGDLDFLTIVDDSPTTPHANVRKEAGIAFTSLPDVRSIQAQGSTRCAILLTIPSGSAQCDLRMVTKEEFPFALNYFTGSKEHNVRLRQRALDRGWSQNEYRFSLVDKAGTDPTPTPTPIPIPTPTTEEGIYAALGLPFIPPELREDQGEIEAAERGELPDLVTLRNVQGSLHNHTTASDGTNTLEEMAAEAQRLGWKWLGIADHGEAAFQANGLSKERVLKQIEEIHRYNDRMKKEGSEFRVLAGLECDIKKDGSIDLDDQGILEHLDYVVASLHQPFALSPEERTEILIKAVSHPLVTLLAHPTGRLLLKRPSSEFNLHSVIEAAAKHKTWVEINAHPWRLDLDWREIKKAKSTGVKIITNPDAHSARGLSEIHHGVTIARKGWLSRKDLLNCLDLESLKKEMKGK
jgi:DNA polymerase (family 10)